MRDLLKRYSDKKESIKQRDYSKQHAVGRLSVAERAELLFDSGTFVEIGMLAEEDPLFRDVKEGSSPRDGLLAGYGKVNGRLVGILANDITVKQGSLGSVVFRKQSIIQRLCREQGFPLVWLLEGSGARLEDEETSLLQNRDNAATEARKTASTLKRLLPFLLS